MNLIKNGTTTQGNFSVFRDLRTKLRLCAKRRCWLGPLGSPKMFLYDTRKQ